MSQVPGTSRDQAADASEPYVVVSIDSHVGPSVKGQLREYCDSRHLADFDRFAAEMEGKGSVVRTAAAAKSASGENFSLGSASKEMIEEFGRLAGVRSPGEHPTSSLQRMYENSLATGLQDPAAREADMDNQGVAADVIFHGGLNGESIPFSTTGLVSWGDSAYNHLEPAGVRIYNRWLADFVSSAPERHAGIAHIPVSDLAASVREVEWAADNGLKGINLPAPRHDLPMLNEPAWEPVWAAAADAGLPLNTHGAGGEHYPFTGPGALGMYMMETLFQTRRGVWVMILGGVFERHPGLKLVLTEQWADWAPGVLADMDGLYYGSSGLGLRETLSKPPSEYFRQHCFIGASFMSNADAKLGLEHGLAGNMMWGDDYPHAEGTWPLTRESIRFTFSDIDPAATRRYLGDTAINVYGLDRDKLTAIAKQIGPVPDEVATPYAVPEGAIVGTYAFRTGPGKFI